MYVGQSLFQRCGKRQFAVHYSVSQRPWGHVRRIVIKLNRWSHFPPGAFLTNRPGERARCRAGDVLAVPDLPTNALGFPASVLGFGTGVGESGGDSIDHDLRRLHTLLDLALTTAVVVRGAGGGEVVDAVVRT